MDNTDDANEKYEDLDLQELRIPSEKNKEELRTRIEELRQWGKTIKEQMEYAALADKAEVTKDVMGKFMQETGDLKPEAYKALVTYLWDNQLWTDQWRKIGPTRQPGALFHALMQFLDVGEITHKNLSTEMPGVFRVWRPSLHVPGQYVLGMMTIHHNKYSGSMHVLEKQVFKGSERESPQNEEYEGVLIKKSQYYIVVARQAVRHKGPPRVTVLSNCLHDKTGVRAMQGLVIGSYGSRMFAAPAYFERIKEDKKQDLENSLNIYPYPDVPPSVLGKLQFSVTGNVICF